MRNFAAQSADIAQLLLGNYVGRVTENGSVVAADGETCHGDDSGRIAYALAALYATQQGDVRLISVPNLIDSVALCIAAQFHYNGSDVEGCIYAMMALLTMGLNLARNAAWSRFQEETQKMITAWSRKPLQIKPHQQIFAVIHGIVAYSLGFTSKDETDRRIDQWLRSRSDNCTGGFMDYSWQGIGGRFDGRAIEHYILLREALQRHGNVHTRERRLPTLRTHMQRYLRLMPDLVRDDGTNWAYGSTQGCSGTLNGISFLLYAFVDNWIETTKQAVYVDALRKLIQHFFMQYLDQENCCICIRDGERNENGERSTVGINFDAIRQILLWSQWAKTLKISLDMGNETTPVSQAKYISFDQNAKKEQGLLIHRDATSGMLLQLPLMSGNGEVSSDCIAFPHCPSVFDFPVASYLPILTPELTFDGFVTTPSFYGKNVSTGMGVQRDFQFRYEQPDLITSDEVIVPNAASCKVLWTFSGKKICGDFVYIPKRVIHLSSFRMVFVLTTPHSRLTASTIPSLCENGLRPEVQCDDFGGEWQSPIDVMQDSAMRTRSGKICFVCSYARLIPLHLRPGRQYRFVLSVDPEFFKE